MRLGSLAFLFGILILQNFSQLPNLIWVTALLVILFLFSFILKRSLWIPLTITLGFAWCLWYAHSISSWNLLQNLEGKPVIATGYIASIPNTGLHSTTFLFALKTFDNKPASGYVKLSWQSKQTPHVGDKWQLMLNLKRIHGTLNPGGFDYEALAFQSGIRANGFVINQANNKILTRPWYYEPINRLRESLKQKIETNLPKSKTSPWIVALALGERQGIAQEYWQVLRNTGTNHLMAIAGLHIGCMAGFAHVIAAWIWRRFPRLLLKIPALHVGAIAALVMAFIYSALAGFSTPTQRAAIMLSFFLVALLLRRKLPAWQAWSGALLTVLLLNPLDVLTASFWLSFGSVALIIYGVSGRLAPDGLWWKYGRIQWVIAVGLIPLGIWLFQQCSLIAFIANSIAIPWVAFLVVPLTLLGCFGLIFSAKIGGLLLLLADKILNILWVILTFLSHISWASWNIVVPNHWVMLFACIGVVILLLPAGAPGRYLGIIWLLPLLLYKPNSPAVGDVWFTLLDVGQGLSTVIQTQNHILVFDAGPHLGDSFDMGASVVVPFLHTLGTKQVDMLVVSHGDNDHIGGANAIIQEFPVIATRTSIPEKLPHASYCLRGQHWIWDDVKFEFLYPTKDTLGLDNDSSCVLRISAGTKHILLTGDIEKFAENHLVTEPSELKAEILVAPHHGSNTSDLDDFIQAVNARFVLFPIGYRNRYHFPHPNVVQEYRDAHALLFDTSQSGAIQILLSSKAVSEPMLYRSHSHYWNFN